MSDKNITEGCHPGFRLGMALERHRELNIRDELIALGRAPEMIDRKKLGKPPAYTFNYTDSGVRFPVYKAKHVVQLVYKQKWQAGKPFSNSKAGKELNECFVAVADIFEVHAKTISDKFYSLTRTERTEIEKWLVAILYEQGMVHKKKLNKAKKLLNK